MKPLRVSANQLSGGRSPLRVTFDRGQRTLPRGPLPLRPESRRKVLMRNSVAMGQRETSALKADYVLATAGGVHVPLRIEGSFPLGQYMRSMAIKSPFGAGNQFASLSAPGVSFWK